MTSAPEGIMADELILKGGISAEGELDAYSVGGAIPGGIRLEIIAPVQS